MRLLAFSLVVQRVTVRILPFEDKGLGLLSLRGKARVWLH